MWSQKPEEVVDFKFSHASRPPYCDRKAGDRIPILLSPQQFPHTPDHGMQEELRQLSCKLNEREEELGKLSKILKEKEGVEQELRQQMIETQAELGRLKEKGEERKGLQEEVGRLESKLSETEEELKELRSQVSRTKEELGKVNEEKEKERGSLQELK